VLVDERGTEEMPRAPKLELARALVARIAQASASGRLSARENP